MRKTTEELLKQALAEQTADSDVPETFRRLVIENERECAEAVGVTASLPGTNNGYTFVAFNGSDVPVGTKLFTFPPAAQAPEVDEDKIDAVSKALHRAWQLGQTYWQQADSESWKQNAKSGDTQDRFMELVEETRAMLAAVPEVKQ